MKMLHLPKISPVKVFQSVSFSIFIQNSEIKFVMPCSRVMYRSVWHLSNQKSAALLLLLSFTIDFYLSFVCFYFFFARTCVHIGDKNCSPYMQNIIIFTHNASHCLSWSVSMHYWKFNICYLFIFLTIRCHKNYEHGCLLLTNHFIKSHYTRK